MHVKHVLQGHLESPQLWGKHVDAVLQKLRFHPMTHEPCLYHAIIDKQCILFLHQVNDFAVAATDLQLVLHIIEQIDSQMTPLGLITRFNGMDIVQT